MRPDFITFTGIDAQTDLEKVAALSGRYPIEWGILFSRNRQGLDNRYPVMDVVERVFDLKNKGPLKIAAHLCGKHAQEVMTGDFDRETLPLGAFDRIQVNHVAPDAKRLRAFAIPGQAVIAQWRDPDSFPSEYQGIDWLYDPSGGRGLQPQGWPANEGDHRVGYAGGINPQNAATVNAEVARKSPAGYWLDMESGIRRDDWLDLDLVEQVCVAIYGA